LKAILGGNKEKKGAIWKKEESLMEADELRADTRHYLSSGIRDPDHKSCGRKKKEGKRGGTLKTHLQGEEDGPQNEGRWRIGKRRIVSKLGIASTRE